VDGQTSAKELLDHNLGGTIHLLEYCRRHKAGFILLSTSRVYSIPPLVTIPVEVHHNAYRPVFSEFVHPQQSTLDPRPALSRQGITEHFSTLPPISLYGSSKKCSEILALEYGMTFNFPVWINRCGVLAGAGQFGKADQGIFSYWIHRWSQGLPLRYIGFGGKGYQVRDCLHPRDLIGLLVRQMENPSESAPRTINLSGGLQSAMSLAGLSAWCGERLGARIVDSDETPRPFDLPWVVLDSSLAREVWNWEPETPVDSILEEITQYALSHPNWLETTGG
jgi:CDP-paratose 2-epimerase